MLWAALYGAVFILYYLRKNLDIFKEIEMRYKLLVCVFVLLVATPVLSQEFSPIVVETGKPVPSVVKSGEPFKVTYRAKFFDTVLIYEEQMQPDNLALEKIEVIGLEVDKNPFDRNTDLFNLKKSRVCFKIPFGGNGFRHPHFGAGQLT